jgi:hypothetical protein
VAGGIVGAASALTGLFLDAGAAILRGAFTGILVVGAAFEAALAAVLAAGLAAALSAVWSVCAGLDVLVLGVAGADELFMKYQPWKLTVHTVYTVDFFWARY